MHSPSIFVAIVAILSTVASAEPDRPKFYFPRQVKRAIFANTTVASQETSQAAFTPSTKRSITDFLNGATSDILGRQSGSADTTGNLLDSQNAPLLPTSSSADPETTPVDEPLTVITVQSTSTVPPPEDTPAAISNAIASDLASLLDPLLGSTGILPSIIVLPTTSDATTAPEQTAAASTTGGITFSPGGIVTSAGEDPTSTALPDSLTEETTTGVSFSGAAASTAPSSAPTSTEGLDIPSSAAPTESLVIPSSAAPTESFVIPSSAAPTETAAPTESFVIPSSAAPTETAAPTESLVIPSSIADPLTTADVVTSDLLPETTPAAESSDLLSSLIASITDLLPTPTDDPASTAGVTGAATTGDAVLTSDAAAPTTAADTTDLGVLLSSILDPATSDLSAPVITDLPTLTTDLPPVVTPTDSDIFTPTDPPVVTPTDSGVVTPTDPPAAATTDTGIFTPTDPPIITPTVVPPGGNSTDVDQPPPTLTDSGIVTPTDPPVTGTDAATIPPPTDSSTPPNGSLPTDSGFISATSVAAETGTDTAQADQPTLTASTNGTIVDPTGVSFSSQDSITAAPTDTSPVNSAAATGTDTATSMWLPSSIIIASSGTLAPGASPTADPVPSSLPKIITGPNSTVEPPEGMKLIQIGFTFPLNWKFVAEHSLSAAQIWQYLPVGLYDGLSLQENQVQMNSLVPLDTSVQLGYVKTLALAWIPQNMLTTLALDLQIPVSAIYNNPDPSVAQLMNYIDPSVPLEPGSTLPSESATGTGTGSSPTSPGGNSGVFNTDAQNTSPSVRSTTAGIAVGCVGAAAAYGAAMFFIARRYKRRKQNHRRSSSITNRPAMRQTGSPALLGGANAYMTGGRSSSGGSSNNNRHSRGSGRSAGNSARTQQISAPMMAENSLGWN